MSVKCVAEVIEPDNQANPVIELMQQAARLESTQPGPNHSLA